MWSIVVVIPLGLGASPAERGGNNLKGVKDFHLKAAQTKAGIRPGLSYCVPRRSIATLFVRETLVDRCERDMPFMIAKSKRHLDS